MSTSSPYPYGNEVRFDSDGKELPEPSPEDVLLARQAVQRACNVFSSSPISYAAGLIIEREVAYALGWVRRQYGKAKP